MASFKNITYSKLSYECMRAYHSVNAAGQLSELFKFMLCCVYPLQDQFNQFDLWRRRELLIASCKWQVAQLANVLNMIYIPNGVSPHGIYKPNGDINPGSTIPNIYIVQISSGYTFAPNIEDSNSTTFAPNIDDNPTAVGVVKIYVPTAIYSVSGDQIVSDIEQIKLSGISYEIIPF